MKSYIGSKIIQAEPEVKEGQDGYKVVYPDGYVSWSPKDVFEVAYREVTENEETLIMDGIAQSIGIEGMGEIYEDEQKELKEVI